MSYVLVIENIRIKQEPSDASVELDCYLTDSVGIPVTNASDAIDEFVVRIPASGLPGSGYLAHITSIATEAIERHWAQSLSGSIEDASDELTVSSSSRLLVDMSVEGVGLSSPVLISTINTGTEVVLTSPATLAFTGDLEAPSFATTGDVTSGSTTISSIPTTADLAVGMTVTSDQIPAFTVVTAIVDANTVIVSQNAVVSGTGVTLSFATNPDADKVVSVSPATLDSSYEGQAITGTGIADATTIEEVTSSSSLTLSQNAVAAGTGVSLLVDGNDTFNFSTSTLSVDYADLVRVVSVIDFSNL